MNLNIIVENEKVKADGFESLGDDPKYFAFIKDDLFTRRHENHYELLMSGFGTFQEYMRSD